MILAAAVTVWLHFTAPAVQNDTLRYCAPSEACLNQLDSLQLVVWYRVRTWRTWPVGWYNPPMTVIATKAVPFWWAGRRDSFPVTLPVGLDSVGTYAIRAHNPRGWGCPGNAVGVVAPGVTR